MCLLFDAYIASFLIREEGTGLYEQIVQASTFFSWLAHCSGNFVSLADPMH